MMFLNRINLQFIKNINTQEIVAKKKKHKRVNCFVKNQKNPGVKQPARH